MTARPQDVALLPCPFCGGTDVGHEYVSTFSVDSSYETFGCSSCGAVFVDGSAEEWNSRSDAALASAQAREDELRAEVEKERERADKFMFQVRDTCRRAERAEAEANDYGDQRDEAIARAERLEEALRGIAERWDEAAAYARSNGDITDAENMEEAAREARAALTTNAAQPGETT